MHSLFRLGSLLLILLLLAACGPVSGPATPTAGGGPVLTATQPAASPMTARTEPTATVAPEPTATAVQEPTLAFGGRQILLEAPQSGASVSSPIEVRGSFTVAPFESTFRGRVYNASGQVVGEAPIMTTAEMGQPGSFVGSLPFAVAASGPGRVEIAELSAADGSIVVSAVVDVSLVIQSAPTATVPPRQIVLNAPQNGASVSSPVQVSGSFTVAPFESTFRGRVYDANGQVVGEGPIMTTAEMGQPGEFSGAIPFTVRSNGPGRVEIAELSAKDGSIIVSASANVNLVTLPATGPIESPGANAQVTLPLHILARVGQPGEQVVATLRWQDRTELTQSFTVLPGEDRRGLVIGNMDWNTESMPPQPPSQAATLTIRDQSGSVLVEQPLIVLSHDDPNVQQVTIYFLLGESLQAVQRYVVRTEAIGTAALNELLWGPAPPNLAGFETAIPTPDQVLKFQGRGPDWGPRVRLLKLTIVDGVAMADFSKEMNAYAGGSLRVKLIRDQITQTLIEFPTVQQVIIAIEGQTEDVLQP